MTDWQHRLAEQLAQTESQLTPDARVAAFAEVIDKHLAELPDLQAMAEGIANALHPLDWDGSQPTERHYAKLKNESCKRAILSIIAPLYAEVERLRAENAELHELRKDSQ